MKERQNLKKIEKGSERERDNEKKRKKIDKRRHRKGDISQNEQRTRENITNRRKCENEKQFPLFTVSPVSLVRDCTKNISK